MTIPKYKTHDKLYWRDSSNFIKECIIVSITKDYDIQVQDEIYPDIKEENLYRSVEELLQDYLSKGLFMKNKHA